VPARLIGLGAGLTVCFLVGIAACVCGDAAVGVASDLLPPGSQVRTILGFTRSPVQDAVTAGCALVDGFRGCDLSAPRVAEAAAFVGWCDTQPLFFLFFGFVTFNMTVLQSVRTCMWIYLELLMSGHIEDGEAEAPSRGDTTRADTPVSPRVSLGEGTGRQLAMRSQPATTH